MNGLDDFRPARTDLAIAVEIIGGADAVRRAAVRELDVPIGFHQGIPFAHVANIVDQRKYPFVRCGDKDRTRELAAAWLGGRVKQQCYQKHGDDYNDREHKASPLELWQVISCGRKTMARGRVTLVGSRSTARRTGPPPCRSAAKRRFFRAA